MATALEIAKLSSRARKLSDNLKRIGLTEAGNLMEPVINVLVTTALAKFDEEDQKIAR